LGPDLIRAGHFQNSALPYVPAERQPCRERSGAPSSFPARQRSHAPVWPAGVRTAAQPPVRPSLCSARPSLIVAIKATTSTAKTSTPLLSGPSSIGGNGVRLALLNGQTAPAVSVCGVP